MIGAIIGDTVGSVYEFANVRSKNFPLYSKGSRPTDDTIMTLAVADILQNGWQYDKKKVVQTFQKWGRAYPDAGYGGRFGCWLYSEDGAPYNSFGNGAAMRISPVGWYANTVEEVREWSRLVTEVTHNHPEGLKGAEVVATCIFYARRGAPKSVIKAYAEQYYNLDFDYEFLRNTYTFNETCQGSVPQAIFCFLISKDFTDCLRTTISIGGDCDTTAAIACSIAEAYYKDIDSRVENPMWQLLPKAKDGCDARMVMVRFLVDCQADSVELIRADE